MTHYIVDLKVGVALKNIREKESNNFEIYRYFLFKEFSYDLSLDVNSFTVLWIVSSTLYI